MPRIPNSKFQIFNFARNSLPHDQGSRGRLRPRARSRASHSRRPCSRAKSSAPRPRPRPGHRPRSAGARSLHRRSRRTTGSMGTCGHASAPLCLRACREKNHKTCNNNLADHNLHLKARPAGSFNPHTQQASIRKMRPALHALQFNSFACAKFPCSKRPLASPSSASSLLTIPYPLFPSTVL